MDALTLYAITILIFLALWPLMWYFRSLSTGKMVVLLFCLDISLTIEGALYSDVVLIAVLHVITIPAFFALIYIDLTKQQKTDFRCFVCGRLVEESEEIETVKRVVNGEPRNVTVHSTCIDLGSKERKAFSKERFRRGIPK